MNAFEPLFLAPLRLDRCAHRQGRFAELWLAFGVVAGIGLENKHSMLVFGFALAAGLLLSGEQRLFRSKWIWIGGASPPGPLSSRIFSGKRAHGWPQIEVVRNAQRFKNVPISPLRFLGRADSLSSSARVAGLARRPCLVFLRAGREALSLSRLGLSDRSRDLHFLHGKTYYPLPVYPLLMAAGGVALELFVELPDAAGCRLAYPVLLVLGGIATVPFGVPLLPVDTFLRYSQAMPDHFA